MTLLIVDASVAAAFTIASQATPAATRLFESWAAHQPIAPYVFQLEAAWLLLKRERQTRVQGFARGKLAALEVLAIELEVARESYALQQAFDLAERYGVGLYDAHYLLLALEAGGVLATRDAGLIRAAGVFGIEVLDVR